MPNKQNDTRWWEWLAAFAAFLFILMLVFGTLPGCAALQGAYESRHNNDSAYWGSVSQNLPKH